LDFIQGGGSGGSRSIKAFIENYQPFLTLHGHIHESPDFSGHYFDRIGVTISVNPGQSIYKGKDFLKLYAVTFEIENPIGTLAHTWFQRLNKP
jgi:Icc-related predicted phosphoesterase